MKTRGAWALALLLLVVLAAGVGGLYRLRVAQGDVFPAYSSLRADPLGTRALHDAAALLPGRSVERWLKPLEKLEVGRGDVVILAGLTRGPRDLEDEDWRALDRLAVGGARVVLAWRAEAAWSGDARKVAEIREDPWREAPPDNTSGDGKPSATAKEKSGSSADSAEAKPAKPAKPAKSPKPKKAPPAEDDADADKAEAGAAPRPRRFGPELARHAEEHERRWGLRWLRRELVTREGSPDARRAPAAPAAWPAELPRWRSDLFFLPREGDGWHVLYERADEPVLVERRRGAGSLWLLADSFVLSNEALHAERATPLVAALLGEGRRIVFVESHLGVQVETGIAMLARRYGLGGAALVALALAALWIWRRSVPLAPALDEEAEVRLSLAPTAGLEALLRRSVAPAELFKTCVDTWSATASPADRARLAARPPASADPVAAYNAAARALSKKHLS